MNGTTGRTFFALHAAEQPRQSSKLVLDITSGKEKKGVLEPLTKAARIANLYAQAGVVPKQGMELALVLHGDATKAELVLPKT